ncbi:hypothetical protein HanXRQr2_Chr04g0173101 [Helianthus annuus]|uniref:Uncharacterized protein n=1 Tax=Helianthus annuus TaxID=4232 RepID=A0A9K3J8G9_HELAN|nr:hypothetical protein HanXRQr2_Chr04g0173101 [Helianthus annuus]KAJ0931854.1 hypothetical protein HanPSC8_Chr04g0166791 [Helianthus annuus]
MKMEWLVQQRFFLRNLHVQLKKIFVKYSKFLSLVPICCPI